MPHKRKGGTLARQWELLKLLPPRAPGKTAKQLAEALAERGFPVTKRTVERDLVELSGPFPLECNDKGAPYGWHWMVNAELGVPGIGVAEALSLQLVEQAVKPLLPSSIVRVLEPKFRHAAAKLADMAPSNRASRWPNKVRTVPPALPLLPPKIAPAVLDTVQEALLADEGLDVEYRAARAKTTSTFRLHPLALVQRGPVTYLVATAFEYDDVRLYAVHRMSAARRVGEPAAQPKGFTLDGYVASGALEFGSGKKLKLEAKVSPELARILEETPLAEDMAVVERGGELVVRAAVGDTLQLRWWILSQGDAVEILRPAALRRSVALQLEAAARRYR